MRIPVSPFPFVGVLEHRPSPRSSYFEFESVDIRSFFWASIRDPFFFFSFHRFPIPTDLISHPECRPFFASKIVLLPVHTQPPAPPPWPGFFNESSPLSVPPPIGPVLDLKRPFYKNHPCFSASLPSVQSPPRSCPLKFSFLPRSHYCPIYHQSPDRIGPI